MSNKPTLRPATKKDALAFYGHAPLFSFKGICAELDGEIIGLCGVYRDSGRQVVFSEIKDAMRPYRKSIARATRSLMDMIRGPVYAFAAPTEPTSGYLLAKLGFMPTGEIGEHGDILVRY